MLRAYLELVRPANVTTAMADVLAGFAVAGLANGRALPALLVASGSLYAGGIVLNDVFDREADARERPERPIPSGRVPAGRAAWLGASLLAAGVLIAAGAGFTAALLAGAIAALVLLYDVWSKHRPVVGPVNMGLCRGLNLALGIAAAPAALALAWPVCLIPTAYVAGVTVLSRGETTGSTRRPAMTALALVAAAVLAVAAVAAAGRHALAGLVMAVVLAWRVLPGFLSVVSEPAPGPIRAAVGRGVLSLVLLDAALAASFAGIGYSVVLVAAALASAGLARRFDVT